MFNIKILAIVIVLSFLPFSNALAGAADERPADTHQALTLERALELALKGNPVLRVYEFRKDASEAGVLQAGLLPNPELELELEEFGGSGIREDFGASQLNIMLGQMIELGGKRGARIKLAGTEENLAAWDLRSTELDVLRDTAAAFVEALAAQELLTANEELERLARETYEAVDQRVEAGKVSPLELSKAKVVLSTAEIATGRAGSALQSARKRLASLMGFAEPEFERVAGDLYDIHQPQAANPLKDSLESNPDLLRWQDELGAGQALLDFNRTLRIPNLKVSGGLQRFAETDETAFKVGVSFSIPIFDRNQGGILAAQSGLRAAAAGKSAARLRLESELEEASNNLRAQFEAAEAFRGVVLPAAEEAFLAAREGYRLGKFGYLEVLDAQRTLSRIKLEYIETLKAWHIASLELQRLTGKIGSGLPGSPAGGDK
jgi:cobalt-zinc-cadmium efflux system outer membrane protein